MSDNEVYVNLLIANLESESRSYVNFAGKTACHREQNSHSSPIKDTGRGVPRKDDAREEQGIPPPTAIGVPVQVSLTSLVRPAAREDSAPSNRVAQGGAAPSLLRGTVCPLPFGHSPEHTSGKMKTPGGKNHRDQLVYAHRLHPCHTRPLDIGTERIR